MGVLPSGKEKFENLVRKGRMKRSEQKKKSFTERNHET